MPFESYQAWIGAQNGKNSEHCEQTAEDCREPWGTCAVIEAQAATQLKKSFPAGNGKTASKRVRRSKKEAAALKRLLKSERKAGVPVAELAKKHGISPAYIYMLQ